MGFFVFSFKKFWYRITEPKVMSAANTSNSKEIQNILQQIIIIDNPRKNKRGLLHNVMIINLSVHRQMYVLINQSQVLLTAVDYQQSGWLVAFPQ